MPDWFEFDRDDLSPVVTLVEGLPVDDGALVVAVEPVAADRPTVVDRLLHRRTDHSPAAVHVMKFHGHDDGDHYVLRLITARPERFAERVPLPSWARLDDAGEHVAVVSAPLRVSAADVAAFARDALDALAPGEPGPWRTVEADAAHVAVPDTVR